MSQGCLQFSGNTYQLENVVTIKGIKVGSVRLPDSVTRSFEKGRFTYDGGTLRFLAEEKGIWDQEGTALLTLSQPIEPTVWTWSGSGSALTMTGGLSGGPVLTWSWTR